MEMSQTGQVKSMQCISGKDFGELENTVKGKRKLAPVDLLTGRKEGLVLADLIFQQKPENWFYLEISQTLMVAQTF